MLKQSWRFRHIFTINKGIVADVSVVNWMALLPDIPSREPIETTCPNCKLRVVTETEKRIARPSSYWSFVASIFCCWCFCIPDKWKDVIHYCPDCKVPNFCLEQYLVLK